ncbi:hypothetical protein Lalb_Chr05g0211571 [Lupinus albus]|uniref:Uncharacterized protein n=1 Tax=Lupinus albus TaxID=3870 RepID=A0A6A4QG58_LUPAL|nr:hypothetical protein Lalb_Chr05g0211571 [Lupinus albus]
MCCVYPIELSFFSLHRFRVSASQRMERVAASGGFLAKQPPLSRHQQQQENMDIMPKQRPQTLDSLFANLKEQRMRVSSRQNNGVQRNGGGSWRPRWRRGGFGH